MENYYTKIKALIKTGAVLETLDSGNQQRTFSRWLGKARQKVESFVPYGFFGSYPAGTKQLLLAKRGNESNIVGLADGSQVRIKKDTKPGEVGFGNPLTQANLYFKENGDLVIEIPKENLIITAAGKVTIDASEINLNSGDKGVARLDDEVVTTAVEDVQYWAWIALVDAFLAAADTPVNLALANTAYKLGIIAIGGAPTSATGKITESSDSVKAGD